MKAFISRATNGTAEAAEGLLGTESAVRAWTEDIVIPTYLPHAPDKNPMFLEKRVYQGSSGRVYPLPFTDRIADIATDRVWRAVWLENEYLQVMILPEIGGRIHAVVDKTSGRDVIYRQSVIKPALVGLAGPWISGGIEFNWPQHHRPATFLPVDYEVEEHADGSRTVWCSDHDPMTRMKGMHGVCLHPNRAVLEVKVRAYNRTPFVQTFLWWANFATRVHEGYRSFFPPDAHFVADHAKRAMSAYPLCHGTYYGVDYAERASSGVPTTEYPSQFIPPACRPTDEQEALSNRTPLYPPNDLTWYANIPVPTSYMCLGSRGDFFGGYDYFDEVGILHIADHHISPGKKQWTWGNHEFGYAWDRNLTDSDGPYIELMAGVYTDNQPDFSFLQPGETKTWSQFWYPIQKIGAVHHANVEAALHLSREAGQLRLGICVTTEYPGSTVRLERQDEEAHEWCVDLLPGRPFVTLLSDREVDSGITVRILSRNGNPILSYTDSSPCNEEAALPMPAAEPLSPGDIATADELFLTGLHLEQYHHATRSPVAYWQEALRRDPLDARCNNALGQWHMRRGEYLAAERCFRQAIQRLTQRNPNPYDGEPFYNLGLCLRYQLDALPSEANAKSLFSEVYASFAKAAWNQAWAGAAHHALAEMDFRRQDWEAALDHLNRSLRLDSENLRARNLKVIALRRIGQVTASNVILDETRTIDLLDGWARHLSGEEPKEDAQAALDIAHDLARAGLYTEAIGWLLPFATAQRREHNNSGLGTLPTQDWGAGPMLHYTLGRLSEKSGDKVAASDWRRKAMATTPDYCFPARLEEITVLETALKQRPEDARASYYLGCLLYDRQRHSEAIALWERSADADPTFPTVWRNLGIGYFNVEQRPDKASSAYARALAADPTDARLLFERDQLWKRIGESPEKRLSELQRWPALVECRDDLSVERCALLTHTGRPDKSLELLLSRRFQPWEGGEGQALGQYVCAHLALGRRALAAGDAAGACRHFEDALDIPSSLGEARHLLTNQSDIRYWLGAAYAMLGNAERAREEWTAAATFQGDFQQMSVQRFSPATYYSALAWKRLGCEVEANQLLDELLAYACEWQDTPAKIDYFATSLPTMLLFEDDIQARQKTAALFLMAQAHAGRGEARQARRMLEEILSRDPSHGAAAELMHVFETHLEVDHIIDTKERRQ
jgi:tetratricopeptide (TPR) repeat protein